MSNNKITSGNKVNKTNYADINLLPQIKAFAEQMQLELEDNNHKGDWSEWDNLDEMLWELEYHKGKLLSAIKDHDKELVKEYIADCGNFLMFIGNTVGVYPKSN